MSSVPKSLASPKWTLTPTIRHVQNTLHEANHHLSAVYVHLSNGSHYWWREFSAAASRIDFKGVVWIMALQEIASAPVIVSTQRLASPVSVVPPSSRPGYTMVASAWHHPSNIPASRRALIPRDANGIETCLRFFGSTMYFGGTSVISGNARRRRRRCRRSVKTKSLEVPLRRNLVKCNSTLIGWTDPANE